MNGKPVVPVRNQMEQSYSFSRKNVFLFPRFLRIIGMSLYNLLHNTTMLPGEIRGFFPKTVTWFPKGTSGFSMQMEALVYCTIWRKILPVFLFFFSQLTLKLL